ncbi:hypothetical protein B0H10DRAFT_1947325 [Mycena sp. CBHHK59/15]|nr:hypothetical protein B0H10DRAFT_1947325 [Mycena sp. CBHHK59/15]
MSHPNTPSPSSPSSPSRQSFGHTKSASRHGESPFFLHVVHEEEDSFYTGRNNNANLEAGCLVPSDTAIPDLTPKKTNRRNLYVAYRRWFAGEAARIAQLTEKEKGTEQRYWVSKLERRVQLGSWCAMVILLGLTILFFFREA